LAIFASGSDKEFNKILENRSKMFSELKITLYDQNWWRKAGDEPRIPLEGFPVLNQIEKLTYKTGTGGIAREIFIPVNHKNKVVGAIGIGIPIVEIMQTGASSTDFFVILVINLLIGVVAAIIVSRSILKPLSGLMEGIDAFADGNYALRVETTGQGELLQLCETFNRMASTVQESLKENLLRNRMLDEKLQELWEIYELTRNMSFSLELKNILERFLEKAQTLSFSSHSQIILMNRITNKLEPVLNKHSIPDVKQEDYENCLNNCFLDGNLQEKVSDGYSMIFISLLSAGKVQGVLFLAKHDNSGYSENIKRFLQTIAPVAASMIENARLYEELSEWNANMKNILGSVSAGMGAIDRKGSLISYNDSFLSLFPRTAKETKPETIQNFCRSLSDQNFAQKLTEAIGQYLLPVPAEDCREKKVRFTTQYVLEDGEIEAEIRMMPLLDGDLVRGCVIVLDDITEQKQFEQQMIESEKWAVLGKLAASVAHEIRNPLVAIRSLVEIIGENVQGDLKEHVSVILGEVLRLNRVVAELLSLVRPESAQMKIAEMKDLIDELHILVRHEAAKNGISIKISLPDEECKILMDPEKMKQAFLNVILNGIQCVDKGGAIEIRVEKSDNDLLVKFRNDGPEIPPAIMERIFEAFFTTKANGTGLGLAITRKIAELHRGRIDIASSPEFTEFTFVLPMEAR
jgi:signal transduction histidine kinase